MTTVPPLVQVAIDVMSIDKALSVAELAIGAGADRIEVGHPLIVFEGVRAIAALSRAFPDAYILVDFMILAGSAKYVQAAKSAGAHNVTVCGMVPHATIQAAIAGGRRVGIDVTVDLFNMPNLAQQARLFEDMGASEVMVHFGVDQKRLAPQGAPIKELQEVVQAVDIPVSYATYDAQEARDAVEAGASILVQGEPLITHPDAAKELKTFIGLSKGLSHS